MANIPELRIGHQHPPRQPQPAARGCLNKPRSAVELLRDHPQGGARDRVVEADYDVAGLDPVAIAYPDFADHASHGVLQLADMLSTTTVPWGSTAPAGEALAGQTAELQEYMPTLSLSSARAAHELSGAPVWPWPMRRSFASLPGPCDKASVR